ncbi:sce7726 family protein [Alkalibacillus haloalkaliphilus]|uniref:sce7726 family protein n=1 Tax=Alkalibacillus haloalkaliphilus TaxID=94136 RepID=UPI0002D681F1|nr:sce7726 family protein [Alkalibacillus haloalkaliphilus]
MIEAFGGDLPDDFHSDNYSSVRDFLNTFLLENYPNETAVKASFLNKVLLKLKNHVSIFELKAGKSRVDLCKINSQSIAYEIKTELDTPSRLDQQMSDYLDVFDRVYLICSKNNLDQMVSKIPKECGVYIYYRTKTGKYIFKKIKSAQLTKSFDSRKQLTSLTKKDLSHFFGCTTNSNKDYLIEKIINENNPQVINKIYKECLKKKYFNKWNFIVENNEEIFDIDYQWFYKFLIDSKVVYQ